MLPAPGAADAHDAPGCRASGLWRLVAVADAHDAPVADAHDAPAADAHDAPGYRCFWAVEAFGST